MLSHLANKQEVLAKLTVRGYRSTDHAAVSLLYVGGLLAGQIAANDTGADIENIPLAYLSDPSCHFWVAEAGDAILGMIAVAHERDHVAEVRRLRVRKDFQQTAIADRLLETALAHCKKHGYLKVVLDTRFDSESVVDLFDRFGFQHSGTKPTAGKQLLEFYLDLYRRPRPSRANRYEAARQR